MRECVIFVWVVVWDVLGARTRHQMNYKGPPLGDLQLRTVRTMELRTCTAYDFGTPPTTDSWRTSS